MSRFLVSEFVSTRLKHWGEPAVIMFFIRIAYLTMLVSSLSFAQPLPDDGLTNLAVADELAHMVAPIKQSADIDWYMRGTPQEKNPLMKLSKASRKEFIRSLKFNEKGLTTYNYAVLESELTVSQAYEVLAFFGAQDMAKDLDGATIKSELDRQILKSKANAKGGSFLEDFVCEKRASCRRDPNYACTVNC